MRINIGCGQLPLDGYLNIDKYDRHADEVADPMDLSFDEVEEVTMFHVLEHVAINEAPRLLYHVAGWLRPGSPGAALHGDVERYARSAQINTFGGGVNEVQREIVAAAGLGMKRLAR